MTEKALEDLINMSRYAGERFDLVQAGGGNTSVKFDDKMFIKASGYLLSEVSHKKGHCTVFTDRVISILNDPEVVGTKDKRSKDKMASEKLAEAVFQGADRPSIETYLHSLLYKFTLHVHAVAVNILTSDLNWQEKLSDLDSEALLIPYETPGIELALLLKAELEQYVLEKGQLPNVVFLQNHGLIISSDSYDEIEKMTEQIIVKAEHVVGCDLSRYKHTTTISKQYNKAFNGLSMTYLSEDLTVNELFRKIDLELLSKPFSPDGFVFCGYTVLRADELTEQLFLDYKRKYFEEPKLIFYRGHLFIIAADLKKAKMIEDVFKNNLLIAASLKDDLNFLDEEEIIFLGNWEAEKYRKDL